MLSVRLFQSWPRICPVLPECGLLILSPALPSAFAVSGAMAVCPWLCSCSWTLLFHPHANTSFLKFLSSSSTFLSPPSRYLPPTSWSLPLFSQKLWHLPLGFLLHSRFIYTPYGFSFHADMQPMSCLKGPWPLLIAPMTLFLLLLWQATTSYTITSYEACHLLELHGLRNLSISHFNLYPSNALCPYSQCFGSSTSLELHLLDPPFSYSFSSIFPTQSRSHKALFSNLEVPGHFLFLPRPSHQPPTLEHQPTCRPVLEVGVACGLSTVEEYLFILFSEVCCVLISPFLGMFLFG